MSEAIKGRVREALRADALGQQLASVDMSEAERLIRSVLQAIDRRIELAGFGEKPRGIVRELEIDWRMDGATHSELVRLPEVSV
ncbi:MAG TPA: hypothetical protein VFE64_11235 [Devosia sp.]|jgi:hypothetical protein|nr:hypothetical protein [Devosia sp.]